jgi:hypothetical protein
MTESTVPVPPDEGVLARAVGIITAPRRTFEGVVKNPRPAAILFLCVLVIALATSLPQFTERGRQAALDMQVQQMEKFTGQPVSDEQYARMQVGMKYGAYFAPVGVFVITPIIVIVFAGIYFVIFNAILGGQATFKQVMGIVAHSMVISTLGAAIGAPIMYIKGTMSSMGPFNLAALVPMLEEKSFLVQFLGFIDPFRVWGTIVTAIGFGVLYKRNSTNIAIALLLVYALIAGGVALFTSGR